MYIVECIPLKRGFQKDKLSYFTAQNIKVGSLVSVPMRSKKIPALVVKTTPLPKEKLAIKEASYSLKKLGSVKSETLYFEETITAAEETAKYYGATIGSILTEYTPQIIFDEGHGLKKLEALKTPVESEEIYILQANEEDRALEYRGLIRECFARNESVLIIFPTIEEMLRFDHELKRGIEEYAFLFHSGLNKKEFRNLWKKALSEEHPVLIIGTPLILTIPRHDLRLLIIEQESSRFYKANTRPYSDGRVFGEMLATSYKMKLILGDTMLRVETLYREESNELQRFSASKMRIATSAKTELVDMKKMRGGSPRIDSDEAGEKRIFEVLGVEVRNLITESLENNERIFLFATRRGLSPITLCGDCGKIVTCNHCGAGVILHKSKPASSPKSRDTGISGHFLCHQCGERRDALESCKVCGSWNLRDFGIGIEKVAQAVQENFGGVNLFLISRDHAKAPKIAREIFDKFIKTPKSILIGTEFALSYFNHKVEKSAIVSLDSLFAVPDYKVIERIFSLILNITSVTKHKLIIQTRNYESFVFKAAMRGDVIGFYREEIKKREMFNWPPYSKIIKISVETKKDLAVKAMSELVQAFSPYELEVFPAFIPKVSGLHALNALLRIPSKDWVDEKIISTLKKLPPIYKIEIDPETIL